MTDQLNDTVKDKAREVLRSIVGQTVSRVSIEQWAVLLLFEDSEIRIEGGWVLQNDNMQIIDNQQPIDQRDSFVLWRLVGSKVINADLHSGLPSVTLKFDKPMVLEIVSDCGEYEDWTFASTHAKLVANGLNLTIFDMAP